MQLLDASMAFALTLAALATIVTTIMEACFRIARIRKKNLIEVMKLVNHELGQGSLKMSPEERWNFIAKVMENPVEGVGLASKIEWRENDGDKETDLATFLSSFGKRKDRKGIYQKVTLEYVLRCLAESDSVQRASLDAGEKLKTELNRIARKYEEYGSAVSASFKQYAQAWSIGIGVLLAFAANVDGLRIYEGYLKDPKLAAAIIEKQEGFIEKNEDVQKSMDALGSLQMLEIKLENGIDTAEEGSEKVVELNKALALVRERIEKQSEVVVIQKTIQDAESQVSALATLGVPIGWDYYPSRPTSEEGKGSATERSLAKGKDIAEQAYASTCVLKRVMHTAGNDTADFLVWIITVTVTGVLIGLGAPFWFDVAKRLAQIRKGLKNPNASSEDRLAAREANGDADERKKIVDDVVADAKKEALASGIQ